MLGVQLSTQKIFFSSYYYQLSVHVHLRSAEFQCVIDFCFLGICSGSEMLKVCYEHPPVASSWLLISLSSTCILLRVQKSHCIDFTAVVSITIFLEPLLINFLLKCWVSIIIHFLDASFDFIYKICFCRMWLPNILFPVVMFAFIFHSRSFSPCRAASISYFLTAALNFHVFLPRKFVSFVFNNSL